MAAATGNGPVPASPALRLPPVAVPSGRGSPGHMAKMNAAAMLAKRAAIAGRITAGVKTCAKCFEVLPFDRFGSDRRSPDLHDHYCSACRTADQRERYQRRKAAQLAAAAEATRTAQEAEAAHLADEQASEDFELVASVRTGVVWRMPSVNDAEELRTTAFVVRYRTGADPRTALAVAVAIDPRTAAGHARRDLMSVAVAMTDGELAELVSRVVVPVRT